MIELILIAVLGVAVLIGAVSGLVKGYAKTSFWGGTVLLALLIERLVGSGIKKENSVVFAIVVIIAAIASLLVLTALFALLRKIMARRISARRTLSEYRNHDELEENETLILNALDNNDKKEYKKLRKKRKKIKTKSGVWGVLNRVFGALFGALNAFVGAFAAVAFIVLFVEISQISQVAELFESFLVSDIWANMLGKIALDMLTISVLSLAIRSGYKSGISSLLSTVIVIGLIVVCAFASWNLASGEAMQGMVSGLEEGMLGALPDMLGDLRHNIATVITAVILFLLSLIVIIIVAIFLPKFVDKFRENKVFGAVDGVFGAIVFTAFIFGLLLVFGGVAYTLNDLSIMESLNKYMANSYFADCLYSCNPLGSVFANLPLRGWFGGTAN